MGKYQDTLDELFTDRLNFEYLGLPLPKPDIEGSENVINYTKEYKGLGIDIVLVECKDRIVEFQQKLIKNQRGLFSNAHFLFVSNGGKIFDLYNNATSKQLRKITYDEIGRNTRLFKEKVQLFDVTLAEDGTELQINAKKAFDTSDRVTKKFFDKFKKVHDKLQRAISGIDDDKDKSWYASVMMNRIMFVYFLQKHNVIQNNPNFLLDKFTEIEGSKKDYYRDFLLPLFFYGFAKRDTSIQKMQFVATYGPIRYLNGGLFYPHHIEKKYSIENIATDFLEEKALQTSIYIDGPSIKEVLEFLDGYTWYLDNRPMKEDTDINPDVLGYIFEKYINQKELGAYYTKEDITEYISKNTIIPFIFDKMRRNGFRAQDPTNLITANEDIISKIGDYIEQIVEYKEVKFLYKNVLLELSVLDPSVGSGAFLFSALNVLLPIYQKVVFRLKEFAKTNTDKWLQEVVAALTGNEEYHLTKLIILNNLYGVDIVEEATEICKLRLFLQLASHLHDIKSIEPLPDIDFNIYAGNSLVGGLSWEDLKGNYTMDLFTSMNTENIESDIQTLTNLKQEYKVIQQKDDKDEHDLMILKGNLELLKRRINRDTQIEIKNPFHWFIEFRSLIENGGFDVVIGNPPYVEYSKVKKEYQIRGFSTQKCGNLYGNFLERSVKLMSVNGYCGVIIPLSFSCTKRMESVQKLFLGKTKDVWLSHYAERPSKLFEGAEVLLNILLFNRVDVEQPTYYSTTFLKWKSEERQFLFSNINYIETRKIREYLVPKFGNKTERVIWDKIQANGPLSRHTLKRSEYFLYYRIGGGRYWKIFTDFQPKFVLNGVSGISSRESYLYFSNDNDKYIGIALLSSSLFYWYFINSTNCRDLNPFDLQSYPIDLDMINPDLSTRIIYLAKALMADYHKNSQIKSKTSTKTGSIMYQEFYPRLSKPILDEIDRCFADHYKFSIDETDFILNYDIKYRVGSEQENVKVS